MNNSVKQCGMVIGLLTCAACSSPSNDRAIDLKDLEKVQAAEAKEAPAAPVKDALTAAELITLADCGEMACVQLFMKDHATDFVHAVKGEFAALHRSLVRDTAGRELIMPMSTLYADVNPQASWRLAHTVHSKALCDQLLGDFQQLGFALVDSGHYRGLQGRQYRFLAAQYPGKTLYFHTTYKPWYWKGLYKNVTWPCYVFEVRAE